MACVYFDALLYLSWCLTYFKLWRLFFFNKIQTYIESIVSKVNKFIEAIQEVGIREKGKNKVCCGGYRAVLKENRTI